jgi:hypothetical protein
MDIFSDTTDTGPAILTLMGENTAYSISTVISAKNHDNLFQTLKNIWFNKFGLPREIHLKEGKVKVSKLAQRINKLTPTTTVTCKNWSTIFNMEIEHQWRLTRPQLLEEDFVNAINFFHNIWYPELSETQMHQTASQDTESLHNFNEEQGQDEDLDEEGLNEAENKQYTHKFDGLKRKKVKLCHHKLR